MLLYTSNGKVLHHLIASNPQSGMHGHLPVETTCPENNFYFLVPMSSGKQK
jgi:hypothetical protein